MLRIMPSQDRQIVSYVDIAKRQKLIACGFACMSIIVAYKMTVQ